MAHLILTCDYEVCGDGQGNIEACVINPVDNMLHTAEQRGFPVTLFVDASEFLRMRSVEPAVSRVEDQLKRAVQSGHDVQLHLHPQWDGASHHDGGWQVQSSRWRIGDLPRDEVFAAVERGKTYLEDTVGTPVDTFRAGAWAIQPSSAVIDALIETGFRFDSTVAPGRLCRRRLDHYDFRGAPDKAWWNVGNEVIDAGNRNLIEVPIATSRIHPVRHMRSLARKRNAGTFAEGCACAGPGSRSRQDRIRQIVDKLSNAGCPMLDFSSLDFDGLCAVTEAWLQRHDDPQTPVVAISHAKNFTAFSNRQFDRWLGVALDEELQPATFRTWSNAAYA